MANPAENEPIGGLVRGLVSDVTNLVRNEVALAKAEASEKLDHAISGVETLLVGTVFAIGAVGVLLTALVAGLSAIFVQWGMQDTSATALSAAIVGLVFAAIGWALIASGLHALRARNLKMDRTASSVRRDVGVVKEKI